MSKDNLNHLLETTDAQTWAKAFIAENFHGRGIMTEDLMLTWFANAMAAQEMAMNSADHRRQEGGNRPVPAGREAVQAVLDDIAQGFRSGDTDEGSVEFLFNYPDNPDAVGDEPLPDDEEFMLRAAYRIGNTMGQGGMRIIGTVNKPRPKEPTDG